MTLFDKNLVYERRHGGTVRAALVFLSGLAALAAGCDSRPSVETGSPPDAALRAAFPDRADRVLAGSEPFTAVAGGFAIAPAADPAAAIGKRGGLSATLPERAEDAVVFHLPGALSLQVHEAGVSGRGGLVSGAVAYPREKGGSFWTATEEGYEEWLSLERGAATDDAPAASWEIEGGSVREAGGAVEIAREDGTVALRVTAPIAYAESGRAVPVRLSVRGARIELWASANGEAVLVDPVWTMANPLSSARYGSSAVLLNTGKVLLTGGLSNTGYLTTAELYDPATGVWSTAAPLVNSRHFHRAAVLSNGKVLVTGGYGGGGYLKSAELYDPAANTWSSAGQMSQSRYFHSAVTLPNTGKVLVLGGYGASPVTDYLSSAELYDPATNTWSAAASLPGKRFGNTATYLPSTGKVLVTGGWDGTTHVAAASLYNPLNNTWSNAPSVPNMSVARTYHEATLLQNGKVLLTGGFTNVTTYLASAEIYDPAANTFTSTGSMTVARDRHSAVLLATGDVVILAGENVNGNPLPAELYSVANGTFTSAGSMFTGRVYHTGTLLGTGKVLVTGGLNSNYLAATELFDPLLDTWVAAGSTGTGRLNHSSTLLADGKVLVAGGRSSTIVFNTTRLYDPVAATWASATGMLAIRESHQAVRLQSGKVLVAGGYNGTSYVATGEVYDPAGAGSWAATANNLSAARIDHSMTLLADGKVLVLGGDVGGPSFSNADKYNPSTNSWSTSATMPVARSGHSATRLADGRVLVAGGFGGGAYLKTTDIYNPTTNTWTTGPQMANVRAFHTSLLLPGGKVLVAGGFGVGIVSSAEIYDPSTNTWSSAGNMATGRTYHAMSALPDGRVLVAGGYNAGYLASSEIYDPSSNTWIATTPMITARDLHTLTLLNTGSVLAVGGNNGGVASLTAAELYNPVVIDDGNPCTIDSWNAPTERLYHTWVANGTPCNDGNACTQSDTCQSGVCTGANPVTCTALDQCHDAGTCNPANGVCSNPNKANGAACSDGNGCTLSDTCQSGACTAGTPVTCTALDQCHVAGTCNPANGVCSNPNKTNGTACNDSNACTQSDTCQSGACTGANPVTCTALDQCHVAGTCNPANGTCSNPNKTNGTACNDGNACTQSDTCQSGACTGASPVTCTALDQCHAAGTCNPANGTCSNPDKVCLYAQPRLQSPVRGDAGDLVLLAGDNFDLASTVVVYQKLGDTTLPLVPPPFPTGAATHLLGTLTPVAVNANGVTVRLPGPALFDTDESYALWAVTPDPANPGSYLFSNGVRINDARPMWMSPGPRASAPTSGHPFAYTTAARPGLDRTLKIVGRNLHPAPNHVTQVRLTPAGGSPLPLLAAANDNNGATHVERFAAVVTLPATLPLTGGAQTDYEVALSRDGVSWVVLPEPLTVLQDPPDYHTDTASWFFPSQFAADSDLCNPCDTQDDTGCLARAIYAGKKYFEATGDHANVLVEAPACTNGRRPTWILARNCNPSGLGYIQGTYDFGAGPETYGICSELYGIPVFPGVNVRAALDATVIPTIESQEAYDRPVIDHAASAGTCGAVGTACTKDTDCCSSGAAQVCMGYGPGYAQARCEIREQAKQRIFNLMGDNVVSGVRFHDTYAPVFAAVQQPWGPIDYVSERGAEALMISGDDVVLTSDFFDDMFVGAGVWPKPGNVYQHSDLVITNNAFGAWSIGLGSDVTVDSVIRGNVFWPGAGIATIGLGTLGGSRVDVSDNTMDGDNSILTPDGNVAAYHGSYTGFRAGMFFPTFGSQEDILISSNHVDCVGTRPGQDGEAITTDSNGDIPALRWGELVLASPAPTATQVTIAYPASKVPKAGDSAAYVGRWLHVDFGQGLGQARKITAVTETPTTLTVTVSPAFDVVPQAGQSRVLIGNQAWQFAMVDNTVDNTCTEGMNITPLHHSAAGVLAIYGTGIDASIEGNVQTDTPGIQAWSTYADVAHPNTPADPFYAYHSLQYFVDIRSNHITGEVGGAENAQNTYGSGIALWGYVSTRIDSTPLASENVPGFGVSVAHNVLANASMTLPVTHAAYTDPDGAIGIVPFQLPDLSACPSHIDTLIFSNDVDGTSNTAAEPYSSAFSNDCTYDGTTSAQSYPRQTILCDNTYAQVSHLYIDCPPAGQASSIVTCP